MSFVILNHRVSIAKAAKAMLWNFYQKMFHIVRFLINEEHMNLNRQEWWIIISKNHMQIPVFLI